jgi:negative regulator of flagellin synthesis FlgM
MKVKSMRINQSTGQLELRETSASTGSAAADTNSKPAAATDTAPAPLQSDTLKPLKAAMDQLPEVDSAKVAEIKAALADGSIKFDAGKLAGLIQRYHGGRG